MSIRILSDTNILKRVILLLMVGLLTPAVANEAITVTGTVIDKASVPMIGATVVIKENPSIGTAVNAEGKYSIKVAAGNHLVFSFIGYSEQTIKVAKSVIDVVMDESAVQLDAVVSIGYGTLTKKELTGATINLKADDITEVVSSDLAIALQGQVPGLSVTASTGEPGAVANIQIRGISSISGSNTPLFVVDGIPQEDNPNLSSNEIESVDVLKDAASASIYGTRGAAGVILITTKEGQKGKLKVSFDGKFGVQSVPTDRLPSLMSTEQQTYFQILQHRLSGLGDMESPSYSLDNSAYYYMNNTNALDMILRDGPATEQTYSVNLSGGRQELTFNTVLGYYGQKGIVRNASFERYNMRNNLVYNKDKLKLNFSLSYLYDLVNAAPGTAISQVVSFTPYSPMIDTNTTEYWIAGTSWTSEVSAISTLLRSAQAIDETRRTTFAANLGLDYKLSKSVTLTTKLGANIYDTHREVFYPNITIYGSDDEVLYDGLENSYVSNTSTQRLSLTMQGGLNYNRTFNKKHKLSGTALISYEKFDYRGFTASQSGVVDNDVTVLSGTSEDASVSSQTYYVNTLVGSLARLMYNYDNRYLLSGSVRVDGSSKFSADNRWGYFPSISAGWNIHQEKFFGSLKNHITNLKLRLSYGSTGNQNISAYQYAATMSTGYDYVDSSGQQIVGTAQTTYVDSDIKWETTTQTNIGVDVGLLKNSLSISFDYYYTDKTDMLASVSLPASAGVGTGTTALLVRNIGDMVNQGMELDLRYRKKIGKCFVTGNFNISRNTNKITSLGDGNSIIYNSDSWVISGDANSVSTVFAEGYEAGAFFLYKTDGVIKTQEELTEYQKIDPDAQLGDLRFVDADGDGQISDDDRVYCGSGVPDVEIGFGGSFSYKNFEISTLWFASIGNEIINGVEALSYSEGRNTGLLSMWMEDTNPDSDIPTYRNTGKEHMNYISYSDYWVEDGSYLRMKTLTLAYNLPKSITNKIKASNIKVYLTGQNLLTFTGYTGMDPEQGGNGVSTRGIDRGYYPVGKKYMVGVKIDF